MRARGTGLRRSEVELALFEKRSIVRTWLMRGTLHVVAAADVRWIVNALGPVFAAGNKSRHAELRLTDDVKHRGVRAIRRILAEHGPLTRYELVERLRSRGIDLDPRSQAPIHLIAFAAFHAVCCLGPERRKGEPTYVLLDDWVKPEPGPSRPFGELARRYFSAYGPAALDDFASWSGLRATQVRTALQETFGQLDEVTHRGVTLFLTKGRRTNWRVPEAPREDVGLLPAFDTYLLGYRSRDLAVDDALQKRLHRGGGWLHPALIVNGRAIGAWSLRRTAGTAEMTVETIGPVRRSLRSAIEAETTDVGRFLGLNAKLEIEELAIAPAPPIRLS
jgi:hypothetical protein